MPLESRYEGQKINNSQKSTKTNEKSYFLILLLFTGDNGNMDDKKYESGERGSFHLCFYTHPPGNIAEIN